MIEQERLKEIKALLVERDKYANVDGETDYSNYDKYINILNDDGHIDWMVERVQKLEKNIEHYKKACSSWETVEFYSRKEAQRYKQALEFYADKGNYDFWYDYYGVIGEDEGEKARQALAGDTNA